MLRFRTVVPRIGVPDPKLYESVAHSFIRFYSAGALIESLLLCPSKDKLNLMNHLKKCILIPEFSKQIKIALSYSSIEYIARARWLLGALGSVGSLARGGGGQHLCMCLSIRMN